MFELLNSKVTLRECSTSQVAAPELASLWFWFSDDWAGGLALLAPLGHCQSFSLRIVELEGRGP